MKYLLLLFLFQSNLIALSQSNNVINDYGIGLTMDSVIIHHKIEPNQFYQKNNYYYISYDYLDYLYVYMSKTKKSIVFAKIINIPNNKESTKQIKQFLNISTKEKIKIASESNNYLDWYYKDNCYIQIQSNKKRYICTIINTKLLNQ